MMLFFLLFSELFALVLAPCPEQTASQAVDEYNVDSVFVAPTGGGLSIVVAVERVNNG